MKRGRDMESKVLLVVSKLNGLQILKCGLLLDHSLPILEPLLTEFHMNMPSRSKAL